MKHDDLPWTGSIEGWTANYVNKHYWQIVELLEFNDALQEGYLVYVKILSKYADVVETVEHFQALYQTSYTRHIYRIANKASCVRGILNIEDNYGNPINIEDPEVPATVASADLRMDLEGAPVALRELIKRVDRPRRPRRCWRTASGARVSTNTYLLRVAEITSSRPDLRGMVEKYIGTRRK